MFDVGIISAIHSVKKIPTKKPPPLGSGLIFYFIAQSEANTVIETDLGMVATGILVSESLPTPGERGVVIPPTQLLRKEVIRPHLPVRTPCSCLFLVFLEAWTISSSLKMTVFRDAKIQ